MVNGDTRFDMDDNTHLTTPTARRLVLEVRQYSAALGNRVVLKNINLQAFAGECLALIGLSDSGKTMLLRGLARFNDDLPHFAQSGRILLQGRNMMGEEAVSVRRQIGFLPAEAAPLPQSIHENLMFASRLAGVRHLDQLEDGAEKALREVELWEELKDRLDQPALALSQRQQYFLSLARILVLDPKVILLDRPCAGLDPVETASFEDCLHRVKRDRAILLAACDNRQASRASDWTAFMQKGEIIELAPTSDIFLNPAKEATLQYLRESS